MFLTPWMPGMLDAYGGGVGFSRRRNRPLQINRSPIGMFGNYALSASLPGMIDEMNQQFEELNHSFDDMIRVFSDPNTRATHVCFEDMGNYDHLTIDIDVQQNLITVTGENTTPTHTAHATRTMSCPFRITDANRVTAESRDGRVLVMIPADAQAPLMEPDAPTAPALTTPPAATPLKVNVVGSHLQPSNAAEPAQRA